MIFRHKSLKHAMEDLQAVREVRGQGESALAEQETMAASLTEQADGTAEGSIQGNAGAGERAAYQEAAGGESPGDQAPPGERPSEKWKRELGDDREEKPNVLAIFLAALIVVVPPLLLAAGLMALLLWLFLHGF